MDIDDQPVSGVAAHPSMITLVRESRGWTQQDLADAAALSQGFISKVETGQQDLRDDRLVQVAKALDCPPGLLLDDAPIRGMEVTCLHNRHRGSRINVTSKKQIEATTHLVRLSVVGLLEAIELADELPLPRLARSGAVEDEDGRELDPASAARDLRFLWHLDPGPIPNLVELLERAGVMIHVRQLGTAAQDAVSSWPPGGPPVMVVNSGLAGDRQRFTIAHELGHLLMHTVPSDDQEHQANLFAGEFLAPAAQIRPDIDGLTTRDLPRLLELKQKWGLSVAALISRAKEVGVISDRQYREFHIRLNRLGWRKVEPGTLEREQPALLDKIIGVQLDLPEITMADLAAAAQMTEPAFRRLFARNLVAPDERPRLKVSTARD